MNSDWINQLRKTPGVMLHEALDSALAQQRQSTLGLPAEHFEMLARSNGIEAYAGHFRIFALGATDRIEAITWNKPNHWKFSWAGKADGFWCFGETTWGDQYAYKRDKLQSNADPQVYFLSAFSMIPSVVASSFSQFWNEEFLPNIETPYDRNIVRARASLGELGLTDHVVYVPSILLGGSEDINTIQRMNAQSAMICNGDIATQLESAPPDGKLREIQGYEDDFHRMRLRLLWG